MPTQGLRSDWMCGHVVGRVAPTFRRTLISSSTRNKKSSQVFLNCFIRTDEVTRAFQNVHNNTPKDRASQIKSHTQLLMMYNGVSKQHKNVGFVCRLADADTIGWDGMNVCFVCRLADEDTIGWDGMNEKVFYFSNPKRKPARCS